jgi:hypothetical protein
MNRHVIRRKSKKESHLRSTTASGHKWRRRELNPNPLATQLILRYAVTRISRTHALQCSDSNCPQLSSADNDLRFLIESWSDLAAEVRHALIALARSSLQVSLTKLNCPNQGCQAHVKPLKSLINYHCPKCGATFMASQIEQNDRPSVANESPRAISV